MPSRQRASVEAFANGWRADSLEEQPWGAVIVDFVIGYLAAMFLFASITIGYFWWVLLPVPLGIVVPKDGVILWLVAAAIFYLGIFLHGYLLGLCEGPYGCALLFPAFPMWFVSLAISTVIGLARFPRRSKPTG